MNAMPLISPIAARAHATHTNTVRATMSRTNTTRTYAVSLTVTSLIVLLGTANLIDVYDTVTLWLLAAAPATVIGTLIAAMGMREQLRGWWQLLALAVAQCIVGPLIALPHTAIFHVVPSLATLSEGWHATFSSFKLIVAMTPPIGSTTGSLMAVWSICMWSSVLAGTFAIFPNPRFCILSVVIGIADCALCALLGTQNASHRTLLGVALAILILWWLSWRWQLLEYSHLLSATLILLLAAVIAFGYCSTVHVQRVILRDYYDPPLSLQQYSSPLAAMRAYIKEHKEHDLLTVHNLPAGASVRLAVMDCYDGNVWNLTDGQSHASSGHYVRAGTTITPTEEQHGGEIFQASFTVHDGMRDYWLPLAGAATQVAFEGEHDRSRDDFFYNKPANSGIVTSGIHAGLSYSETGMLAARPSDGQIRHANAAHIEQAAIADMPDAVSSMALALAGGQSTAGAQALALAHGLREHGWFSHGLANDYPSNSGHGNYRLAQLLGGTVMVGDSEQYASAMALMARSLGLPSRVVLGFVPKDGDGDPTESRTERTADGQTTVTFTGNDICAWVEILLEDYG
ncbi:transglutaminase-like domain-containing protein [Bifidobacterium canis]|uniref:Transglutaminase n=1 Tax=Bifidobacterium canis TaxID=2610880 RepID=A0A7K1J5B0_9BIFI|nr:transglutaminase-like domain-containing protein [Bifidobacterium canis]MUH59834.1 transglutaminase [Bifidobacterium canis]